MDVRDQQIIDEFHTALRNGEITFYLQPQCKIPTREVVEAEALARWCRPDGTIVSLKETIPVLERNGMISQLDVQIWEQVCAWLHSLQEKEIAPVRISVNVSYYDILELDVPRVLEDLCREYRIPNDLLAVEITETVFASQFDTVNQMMMELHAMGFSTLMDDFGSGYSSLNMLNRVSIDVIKLDMAFMEHGKPLSHKSVKIIESIINMAKMIGQPLVVEGVETAEQENFLRASGCHYAQGYYYYRPMPTADFESLLRENNTGILGFQSRAMDPIHGRELWTEFGFSDALLNSILGPVALLKVRGRDISIFRYNTQFGDLFRDVNLDARKDSVQDFILKEDLPDLYDALETAREHPADGDGCGVRVRKFGHGIFWYELQLTYLKEKEDGSLFYINLKDTTVSCNQALILLDMLRKNSLASFVIHVDRHTIQYYSPEDPLGKAAPSMNLEESVMRTVTSRMESDGDIKKFIQFFDSKRIREQFDNAVYSETIRLNFRLGKEPEPLEFRTFYAEWSHRTTLRAYCFVTRVPR